MKEVPDEPLMLSPRTDKGRLHVGWEHAICSSTEFTLQKGRRSTCYLSINVPLVRFLRRSSRFLAIVYRIEHSGATLKCGLETRRGI